MMAKPSFCSILFVFILFELSERTSVGAEPCKDDPDTNWNQACSNEGVYTLEKLFPAFITYLNESLDHPERLNKTRLDYNNIHASFRRLARKLVKVRMDGLYCGPEHRHYLFFPDDIKKRKQFKKEPFETCTVLLFRPIIGVIALYRNETAEVDGQGELDTWIRDESMYQYYWDNDGKWVKEMVRLMKKVLIKVREDDANVFTREVIYSKLNQKAPMAFPMKESPLMQYIEKWYNYVRNADDQKLGKLFGLKMDDGVMELCKVNSTKSLLCSFMEAKNKYAQCLLHLPQSKSKQLAVSINADYGQNGLYSTIKKELDRILDMNEFKASIDKLGDKLANYFGTLARFDNAIAKADVDYVTSAIKTNNDQLTTNAKKMDDAVQAIKVHQKACIILDMIENIVKMAFAIAATVATAGAAAPAAVTTATLNIKDAFDVAKITAERANEAVANSVTDSIIRDSINGAKGGIENIMNKFSNNTEKINDMALVVKAVLTGSSFNSTQKEVSRFLQRYSDYNPAVTKSDLAELNSNYTQMLDNVDKTSKGFICTLVMGVGMAQKIKAAKLAWASINSLLEDILGQQFQLIDALVKVVRSKLDESAAKRLESDTNYNFEIVVRYMLDVRVAAQQFCDTYKLMNNDVPDNTCERIKDTVFLSGEDRNTIMEKDEQLRKELKDLGMDSSKINERFVYIPVSGEGSSPGSINWDDLIDHKGAQFVSPANNQFLKDNGWSDFPDEIALLKSLELFLPTVFVRSGEPFRFIITATQENVTVNVNPKAEWYTIKSSTVRTRSTYTLNRIRCGGTIVNDFYVKDQMSRYCIPSDSGRFINGLRISLPVSMYSKFHIQLTDGLDDNARRVLREEYRPFNDTLKLRGIIQVYSNPAGGFPSNRPPVSKHRNIVKSKQLDTPLVRHTKYCGDNNYRRIINTSIQNCTKCPEGSHAVARGSYCAVTKDAKTPVK